LIYRACIDIVFPRRRIRLPRDEIEDPLQLFEIALRHFDPDILTNRDAWNKDGPAEVIFQWELFAAFRDLLPRGWSCLGEIRESQGGQKRLDLMVYSSGKTKWAGFELKVNKVEASETEESINQAMGYLQDHAVDIYLLNFCLDSRKQPPIPVIRRSTQDETHRVVTVNITHTTKCDEFDVMSEEKSWRAKVDMSPANSPKFLIKRAIYDGDVAMDSDRSFNGGAGGATARELRALGGNQQTEHCIRKRVHDDGGHEAALVGLSSVQVVIREPKRLRTTGERQTRSKGEAREKGRGARKTNFKVSTI
jgi:hypothetical protein